jgi:hypothetical protein
MYLLIFLTASVWNLSSSKKSGRCTYWFITSISNSRQIWTKMDFLDKFSKNTQIKKIMKFRPLGIELFHADGRTNEKTKEEDTTNLKVRFSQYF